MGAVDDAAIGDWVKDRRRALSRWKMESKLFEIVLLFSSTQKRELQYAFSETYQQATAE